MKTVHILNLGAGVQSTALYLMSLRGDEPDHVPRFDCAIFADTQDEPRAVYDHLEWLKSLGGPPILVKTAGRLSEPLLNATASPGGRFASIPCFTADVEGQNLGITRRQCTREYKVDVIEKAIRSEVFGLAKGQRSKPEHSAIQYIGLSFDEPGRIIATKGRFQNHRWSRPSFPLWDLQMTRGDCLRYLSEAAPGREIPRSACVYCPYRSNAEWRKLRDNSPADWQKALEVDRAIRDQDSRCAKGLDRKLYLHRSCVPLDKAPIDTPESRGEQHLFGFAQDCEGMCGL